MSNARKHDALELFDGGGNALSAIRRLSGNHRSDVAGAHPAHHRIAFTVSQVIGHPVDSAMRFSPEIFDFRTTTRVVLLDHFVTQFFAFLAALYTI